MPEKPQVELKDIQEPSEQSSAGLEIVQTEELESVVAKANELAEAIQQDRKITGEQVLDLEKDLGELKVDICGEQMTIAEIREIPNYQMNLKIWQEIYNGNFDHYDELTYLNPGIARKLVEYSRQMTEKEPDAYYLSLKHLKTLSLESAEILVKRYGYLDLEGLEDFPEEILSLLDDEFIYLPRKLASKIIEEKRRMGLI